MSAVAIDIHFRSGHLRGLNKPWLTTAAEYPSTNHLSPTSPPKNAKSWQQKVVSPAAKTTSVGSSAPEFNSPTRNIIYQVVSLGRCHPQRHFDGAAGAEMPSVPKTSLSQSLVTLWLLCLNLYQTQSGREGHPTSGFRFSLNLGFCNAI